MAICGLNISLDSLQEDITTKVSAILEIEPTLITPAAVKTYLTSLFEPTLDALKVKVDGLIPDIPVSLSGFSSLRSDLSAIVSSGGSGLSGFLSTYSSVSSLSGMANINLSDLANSAISLGGSFDPCSVINVMKGASGDLEQLAEDAPEIGKTVLAGQNLFADQSIIDLYAASQAKIVTLTESMDVATLNSTIASNIQQAKNQFTGGSVQKLTSGMEQLLTKVAFTANVVADAANMVDEATEQYI
tara:strand:+ start:101 stop:835 length:735 start_codon:yes stop_codon:yes gene_type:complete